MPIARLAFVTLALGLLCAAGCGPAKLNENRTLNLEPGDAKALELDAQPKPQKITVEFSSSASEVSVYLIKSQRKEEELTMTPSKDITLEMKKGKEGSFSVDVPEKTAMRVVVRGATTKTDVTLKVTNKQ